MTTSPEPKLPNKLFRIGMHLACLLVHPAAHVGFHLAGIAREFRF
jgi:hypothetical protein